MQQLPKKMILYYLENDIKILEKQRLVPGITINCKQSPWDLLPQTLLSSPKDYSLQPTMCKIDSFVLKADT